MRVILDQRASPIMETVFESEWPRETREKVPHAMPGACDSEAVGPQRGINEAGN